MKRAHLAGLLSASLLLPLVSACGAGGGDGAGGKPQVVAAFYPLAWAAKEVGGDQVTVTDLTTPGVEPHDLELNVKQTASVADADLVVYEKDFQPAVDQAVKQNSDHGFDVADVVDLEQTAQGPDPHFWQDPARMADYVTALGERLGKLDADHASTYTKNADALVTKLKALDADYAAGLRSCKIHTIVVSHDAFGYLGKYDVEVAGIAGLSPDSEPSAKHIAQLQDLVRTDGVTTIFSETLAPAKLADTIARDTGVKSEVLDPIEGVGKDAPAGTDYLSLMTDNLSALKKANICR